MVRSPSRLRFLSALCVGNAIAIATIGALPIWVDALTRSGIGSLQATAWLATAVLLASAAGTLGSSAMGRSLTHRVAPAIAASGLAAGSALATISSFPVIAVGIILANLSGGSLIAMVNGAAARSERPQQIFASINGLAIAGLGALYFFSPSLVHSYGVRGLFILLMVLAVAAIPILFVKLPDQATAKASPGQTSGPLTVAPLLACCALAVLSVSTTPVSTYVITFGRNSGLPAETLGLVMGLATPVTLIGILISGLLGERLGHLRPLGLGIAMLGASCVLLTSAGSGAIFSAALGLFNLGLGFYMPISLALLSRLDLTGRTAGASQGIIMISGAFGPKIGGQLIAIPGFPALAYFAAFGCLASILLFTLATRLSKRSPQAS